MNFTLLVKDFNKHCTIKKGYIIELFTLKCDLQLKENNFLRFPPKISHCEQGQSTVCVVKVLSLIPFSTISFTNIPCNQGLAYFLYKRYCRQVNGVLFTFKVVPLFYVTDVELIEKSFFLFCPIPNH